MPSCPSSIACGTLSRSVRSLLKKMSVEPCYFLYTLTFGMGLIVTQELYIQKVCLVNLNFSRELCHDIQRHEDKQNEVQKHVASLKVYKMVFRALPSVLFTLLAGPWSDVYGRKPLLLLGVCGQLAANFVYLTSAYFFYELRAEYLLFELIEWCLGGESCFITILFAYVSDVTTEEARTQRMAILSAMWPLGCAIGQGLGAVMKEHLGYVPTFVLRGLLPVISMIYMIGWLKESKHNVEDSSDDDKNRQTVTKFPCMAKYVKLLHYRNVLDGVKVVLVKRPRNKRTFLLCAIFCFGIEMIVSTGQRHFPYLYLRKKLAFTLTDFTVYHSVWTAMGVVSQLVFVPLLSQKLGIRDAMISFLDGATSAVQHAILAVVTQTWMLYAATAIAFLNDSSYCIIRSIVTKLADAEESGRVLSMISIVGNLMPLIAAPLIGSLYTATVSFMPEAIYYLMAGLYAILAIVMAFVDGGLRNQPPEPAETGEEEEMHPSVAV